MELTFIRHGEAVVKADNDKLRTLTDLGKNQILKVGKYLSLINETFDLICSSPYLRARETAEIIANVLNISPKLISDERLSCGATLSDIQAVVKENSSYDKFLFVGHMPDFGMIGSQLLGSAAQIDFKTGSILKISAQFLRPGGGCLQFYSSPSLIPQSL